MTKVIGSVMEGRARGGGGGVTEWVRDIQEDNGQLES